jgi:ABC-type transport system involved in cytochrome bd biosynthesis fused ATPase/permease subunit
VEENVFHTPQHPKLRNKTLLENVYAGADVTAEDVDRVLRESGLNHVADAFKPRYDKTVGVGGKMLPVVNARSYG